MIAFIAGAIFGAAAVLVYLWMDAAAWVDRQGRARD